MLLPTLTKNSKVINKYLKEMPHEVMEDIPHYPLEGAWCIAYSKGHPPEGIGSPISNEGGVDLITQPDVGLMVPCHAVQECVHHVPCYMVQDDINEGKRVSILLGGLIQFPIILAYPDLHLTICPYLLGSNYYGGHPFTMLNRIDEFGFQQGVQFFFHLQ